MHLLKVTSAQYLVGSVCRSNGLATALQQTTQAVMKDFKASGCRLELLDAPSFDDGFLTPLTERLSKSSDDQIRLLPSLKGHPSFSTMTRNSPGLILHSSGSTSFPKPIYVNQLTALQIMSYWRAQKLGYQVYGLHALPSFHSMGFVAQIAAPFACECSYYKYAVESAH